MGKKKVAGKTGSSAPQVAQKKEERVDLLNDQGDATPEFKRVLIELFGRFDVDGDKLLNKDELLAFSRTANPTGREFTTTEFEEICEHFDWKGNGPNSGGLTLRGWLQMYVTQSGGDEEETWRDLHQLGFDGQLQKRAEKKKRTKCEALQEKLEALVALGEAADVEAFVSSFVPADLPEDERAEFVERLRKNDNAELNTIVTELKCCATGEGVYKIKGEKREDGPITFLFPSPLPGAERIDREVAFVRQDGEWRVDC
jgi:hypothetical protein